MFDHENVSTVNPTANRAEQLANIRMPLPLLALSPCDAGHALAVESLTRP